MKEYISGYALALFSIAKEEEKLKLFKNQSLEIIQAIDSNEQIIMVLNSKSVDSEERIKLVKKAFKGTNISLINFMSLLVQRSKFNLATKILNKLIKLINKEENVQEGIAFSVDKLTPAQVKALETKTSKMLGVKVTLTNKIDASLVSGIKIHIGDEIIEDTMSSRFEDLKNQLLEREDN